MRKLISKIAGTLLGLSLVLGVGVLSNFSNKKKELHAVEYQEIATFDFSETAASGSTSTQLTNDTIKTLLNNSTSDSTLVSSVTNKSGDVYSGKGSGAEGIPQQILKVGKASGGGSFTFTVKDAVDKIAKIDFVCYGWKTTSKLSINSSATQSPTTAATEWTPSFVLGTSSRSISVAVTTSAVCVSSMTIYKEVGGGGGDDPAEYTVSFDMQGHGTQVSSQTITDGGLVTQPSPAPTAEGYTFEGWFKEASCTNAWVFSTDTVSDDTTIYAKWTEISSDEDWVATSLEDLESDDVFVIVNNNGSNYALPSSAASSSPSVTEVTVSEGKITSYVNDSLKWNVSGNSSDGYVFAPNGSTTSYLYLLADSNTGVRVGSASSPANHFTIDHNLLYTTETTYARHIGVYNSSDWRCYKPQTGGDPQSNFKDQYVTFYKFVEESTPGTKVKLSVDDIEMELHDSPVSIVVKNADDLTETISNCSFSSSDTAVVSINNGQVVAQGKGSATITVTHSDDTTDPSNPITYKSTTFTVTVVEEETIESIVKACEELASTADLAGTHTIKGTVTGNYSSSSKKNYMIQQGDYGMYLYDTGVDLNVGEVVRATGTFCRYKNWFEGKSFTSVVKLSTPAESISAPVITSLSDLTDDYQNRVVTFTGLTYVSGEPGSSDTSITFSLGGNNIILRTTVGIPDETNINSKLADVKAQKDTATFNLVGVHYTVFNSDKQFKVDNAAKIQIVPNEASVTDLVQGFVDSCMHLSDIPVSEESRQSSTNACSVTGGYYEVAKAALNALGQDAIDEFKGNDIFNDAQERYESWAEIYGDTTPYSSEYTLVAGSAHTISPNNISTNASTVVIVVVALTSITSIGVLLVIKRKRSLVK